MADNVPGTAWATLRGATLERNPDTAPKRRSFATRAGVNVGRVVSWLLPPLCIALLIWPALWNGYPIVFADTGTYLSQAMHWYLGWDRPVFYSLFIYPLHAATTTWPVIVAQSALAVLVLDLTRRALDVSLAWLLGLTAFLSVASWLPWTVSELMPDLFTPLLILLLTTLVFATGGFRRWQRMAVILLAASMITTQQSSVPLAIGLLVVLIPIRWIAGQLRSGPPSQPNPATLPTTLAPLLAPALAIVALILVNSVGFGRVSMSPYGNVFVLARVIYDGPGMTVLRRDCPKQAQGQAWRLCSYLDRFPATADEFLWAETSPVMLASGHKAISADADEIIRAAIRTAPEELLAATWNNTIEQLTRFASGDGLEPWHRQVGSRIDADFPASEASRFHAARQQMGGLSLPPPLAVIHSVVALSGIVAAIALLPIAWRRRHVAAWYLIVSLLTLPLSAAITGGLSTPHDRYQSRIIWLPACIAFLSLPALTRRRRNVPA